MISTSPLHPAMVHLFVYALLQRGVLSAVSPGNQWQREECKAVKVSATCADVTDPFNVRKGSDGDG